MLSERLPQITSTLKLQKFQTNLFDLRFSDLRLRCEFCPSPHRLGHTLEHALARSNSELFSDAHQVISGDADEFAVGVNAQTNCICLLTYLR